MFTNGVETPFIETIKTEGKNLVKQELMIDPKRKIRQISILFGHGRLLIGGIRLIDEHGQFIINKEWNTFSGSLNALRNLADKDWVTKDVPIGEEIVGF